METATALAEQPEDIREEIVGAIDCDVHPNFRNGIKDLEPYLSSAWRERFGMGPAPVWAADLPGSVYRIPTLHYYVPGGNTRPDTTPPDGGPPASDPQFLVEDLIERHALGAAILNGGAVLGLGGIPEPDAAAAIAAAHNDWIADTWLSVDDRIKGSIVVGPRDPVSAVKEIQRWADHPGMVQIHLPDVGGITLGKQQLWPIYEAAESLGFPVAGHPGGQCAGANGPMMTATPTYFAEYYASIPQTFQAHVVSLVLEGALDRFPKLKVVLIEGGFSWLPHVMWRLEKSWKALRHEVPWVKRPPTEYILDQLRFTTQPLDEPRSQRHLKQLLDMIDADKILMFSTDYPHWDADMPELTMTRIPAEIRRKVFVENAKEIYTRI